VNGGFRFAFEQLSGWLQAVEFAGYTQRPASSGGDHRGGDPAVVDDNV